MIDHSASLSLNTSARSTPHASLLAAAATLVALGGSLPAEAAAGLQFALLGKQQLPLPSGGTLAAAAGDIDGDGDVDLVFARPGQNRLYVNDGTGRFGDVTITQLPVDIDTTNAIALGDVDGDGDLDLVTGNGDLFQGQRNRLYVNDGTGTFTDESATRLPIDSDRTLGVALGDVDGDGDLDLVCANNRKMVGVPHQSRLFRNDGTGTFTEAATTLPGYTTSVALADLDGDGDRDLVFGRGDMNLPLQPAGLPNRLYVNDGTGTFTDESATRLPIDASWTSSLALGDVDGDGDTDIVCGNGSYSYLSQQNRLYRNNGLGVFSDDTVASLPAGAEQTHGLALGDVDGDGDLDLFAADHDALQPNRLYLNSGTGSFVDVSPTRLAADTDWTNCVVLADLDSDQDVDAVFGNGAGPDRICANLQRQIDAPDPLRVGQPFRFDAYARYGPPGLLDIALPYLSTTRISVPLPPLGVLGIDPMAAIMPIVIPQPAGVASETWMVPNATAAIGIEVYAQALNVAWPATLRLSNTTADVLTQ